MAWSGTALDIQTGVAVDSCETRSHHQIIQTDYNRSTGETKLHYSVFYAPLGYEIKNNTPTDFVDRLCCKTPDSREELLEMENYYARFLKSVRPYKKQHAFNLGELAQAVTYDLTFDHRASLVGFEVRPTLAKMTAKYNGDQASGRAFSKPQDRNLRLWHDTVLAYKQDTRPRINFGHVTNITTEIVQRELIDMAVENSIDFVYRIDPEKAYYSDEELEEVRQLSLQKRLQKYSSRYGSILKAKTRKENPIYRGGSPRIPSTAARADVDFFNLAVAHEFQANGRNVFPEGTAMAIANYKRHIETWKCKGMMAA